jgi:hypothetical protein
VPEELRAAVLAGDPGAMMTVATQSRTREAAVHWSRRAAEAGHPPGLLAMALFDADRGAWERARAWLARLPTGLGPRERIVMPPDLYARQGREHDDGGWETSPAFLVVSPDGDRACRALSRAADRFAGVTADGREVPDPEDEDVYTPNYVSNVYISAAGALVYVDTKGELTAEMGGALLRVLAQELARAEVTALVTAPPPNDHSLYRTVWVDPDPPAPQPAPAG